MRVSTTAWLFDQKVRTLCVVERIDIKRVKRGEAPDSADRIYIDRIADGQYAWTGTVDVGGEAVFGGSPAEFNTVHEAEADAVAWAMGHGASAVLIEADEH